MPGTYTNRTRVELMGRTYTIKGDADADYMSRVAGYVNEKMESLRGMGGQDPLKLALLVALNITDELFQVKHGGGAGSSASQQLIEEKTRAMLAMLEKGLIGEPLH